MISVGIRKRPGGVSLQDISKAFDFAQSIQADAVIVHQPRTGSHKHFEQWMGLPSTVRAKLAAIPQTGIELWGYVGHQITWHGLVSRSYPSLIDRTEQGYVMTSYGARALSELQMFHGIMGGTKLFVDKTHRKPQWMEDIRLLMLMSGMSTDRLKIGVEPFAEDSARYIALLRFWERQGAPIAGEHEEGHIIMEADDTQSYPDWASIIAESGMHLSLMYSRGEESARLLTEAAARYRKAMG